MKTGIPYLDHVFNPTAGCSRISSGCANCYAAVSAWRMVCNPDPLTSGKYAETIEKENARPIWTGRVNLIEREIEKLKKLQKSHRSYTVGIGFNSDLFHPNVPMEFIDRILTIVSYLPEHRFLFLTKRPDRMNDAIESYVGRGGIPPISSSHLWFGVTVESPDHLYRLDELFECSVASRWASFEPLLVDLGYISCWLRDLIKQLLNWVVVGGETGKHARPMDPDWARRIRDACFEAGVPFYFKQMSGRYPIPDDLNIKMLPFGKEDISTKGTKGDTKGREKKLSDPSCP